ncbi:hypothetical protein V8F06_014924 [Rhypophila decipiens]
MDWEPTRISQAIHKANEKLKGKRAKWVDQEEIDRRKSEGRCLRCGRTGCRVNKCPLLPARRPDLSNGTKIARSRPVLKAEVEDESEDQLPFEQMTPGGSRRQGYSEAEEEWEKKERKMDGRPFYVNFGINGTHYTKAFIDSGCLCFASISQNFARRLRLPRIPITPRDLKQVNFTAEGAITHVAYADTDIDGHKRKRVFFYVVPGQDDDVILGRPWMDLEDVTISPARGELTIGTSGLVVKERDPEGNEKYPLTQLMACVFGAEVRRARKNGECNHSGQKETTKIFAASLADIEKALAPKKHSDPREKLPMHYHEFLPLFDRKEADRLPPHRPGVDHAITLEKDENGKS